MALNVKLTDDFVARKRQLPEMHECIVDEMEPIEFHSQKPSWFARHAELILICCLVFMFVFVAAKAYDLYEAEMAIINQESIR